MVSVVIPTRNRQEHIYKVLASIEGQSLLPEEVLIIDSSDDTSYQQEVLNRYRKLNVSFNQAQPSVCTQRNMGILAAKGDWILLLDDDIAIEETYIEKLMEHCHRNPDCGAVAGRLMQLESGRWVDQYPPPSFLSLLFKFVFQLPVWGNVFRPELLRRQNILAVKIEKWYRERGNTFTKGGWPLITDWPDQFTTSIYSLGANLVKREWLIHSPYDENLDKNGIGDNYGVALGFPGDQPIHVVSDVKAFHYRASENRLQRDKSYKNRLFALHYFISDSKRFNADTIRWYYWSLMGNALYFFTRANFGYALKTLAAFTLMVTGRNPYALKKAIASQRTLTVQKHSHARKE